MEDLEDECDGSGALLGGEWGGRGARPDNKGGGGGGGGGGRAVMMILWQKRPVRCGCPTGVTMVAPEMIISVTVEIRVRKS